MRYTIETAKQVFKEKGCELLETEFKNTPMLYRCS